MKTLANSVTDLIDLAIQRFGSASKVSRATGISCANLSRWQKGDRSPRVSEFSPLLEALGITLHIPGEELFEFALVPKVAAKAGAGASLETSGDTVGLYAFRRDFLGASHINENHAILIDVIGDSMEPLFKEGDTLLVDRSQREIWDGKIYLVTLGDELRVKRVHKSVAGLILRSANSFYPDVTVAPEDMDTFIVHGRVRWCGKML